MLDHKQVEELLSNPSMREKVESFLREQVVDSFDIEAEKDTKNPYILITHGMPSPGAIVELWTGWQTVNARVIRVAKTGCILMYSDIYVFARYPNIESNITKEEAKRCL